MTEYADLEVRILSQQQGKPGFPVEITLRREIEFPPGMLDESVLPWVPSGSPQTDGERLFALLFSDDRVKTAWSEARGQHPERRIRLRIDDRLPGLHAIPWELLRDPGGPGASGPPQELAASRATPFSRYIAGQWRPGAPVLKRPVKMLVAIAAPDNLEKYQLHPVDIAAEWSAVQQAAADQQIELCLLPQPVTLASLEAALREGFHVLHFIGHGMFSLEQDQAALVMAGPDNQAQRVQDREIAAAFARCLSAGQAAENSLRMVFLTACQSAQRSPAGAFRGLAPQLVAAGVPAVLAMQDLLPMDTARQFTAVFYHQLLEHGLVDLAANEARSSVLAAGLRGAAAPVLFSRLPENRLLGQRGRITSQNRDSLWPALVGYVDKGMCTAFIGPGVNQGLLPQRERVAETLADRFGYPFPDRFNLARVAQFVEINAPGLLRETYQRILQRSLFGYLDVRDREQQRRYKNHSFTETVEALNWSDKVQSLQENEIHHMLARLRLPLYITTNFDNFMFEALKRCGADPLRAGPRWLPKPGSPEYNLDPEPSANHPVVFHLNGHDGDPEQFDHLVLSEDDYLAHIVRLSLDRQTLLPSNLFKLLSSHSFLFLGYQLDDWEFRAILQGLVRTLPPRMGRQKKRHVGVQLAQDQGPGAEQTMDYLSRYMGQFEIEIYWGSAQQFMSELFNQIDTYEEDGDDE
jgi:hypothetical protein